MVNINLGEYSLKRYYKRLLEDITNSNFENLVKMDLSRFELTEFLDLLDQTLYGARGYDKDVLSILDRTNNVHKLVLYKELLYYVIDKNTHSDLPSLVRTTIGLIYDYRYGLDGDSRYENPHIQFLGDVNENRNTTIELNIGKEVVKELLDYNYKIYDIFIKYLLDYGRTEFLLLLSLFAETDL